VVQGCPGGLLQFSKGEADLTVVQLIYYFEEDLKSLLLVKFTYVSDNRAHANGNVTWVFLQ